MSNVKPIGGFFELEVPALGAGYHSDALALTNGRACMRWILEEEKPSRVYIPYYSCYALYEPMQIMGIEVIYYSINEAFEPADMPEPEEGELLVLINYYGLNNKLANELSQKFGKRVVIDNAHRFFHRGSQDSYSFTSARKYFGVPDGAYLYGAVREAKNIGRNIDISVLHNVKRLMGRQEESYSDFLSYEASLGCDLKRISVLSECLLSGVDYETAAQARVNNFNFLHERLKTYNEISIEPTETDVPFCYPFLPDSYLEKSYFHKNEIYIPTLWPDILERSDDGFELEKDLTKRLLPLPVDQRYTVEDMDRVAEFITRII